MARARSTASPEAVKQAAVADRLIVTKSDLAEPAALAALEVRLRALNPGAPLLRVEHGAVDPSALFGLGLFDPQTKSVEVQRWLQDEAVAARHGAAGDDEHHHDANGGTTSTAMIRASGLCIPATGRSHGARCRAGSMRWRRCAATICCG